MKKLILKFLFIVSVSLSFSGCADAIAQGAVIGATEVGMQAGIESSVKDKEQLQRDRSVARANAQVSWWKFQKLFGAGPLASKENQD